ncbi:hypothetical protein VTN77DRAFT_9931 [Rasamsonia byssochlamydoides]|uniref:uncharacterized protein n=1 Tax=Rasamsonia byssochlamydoides TaxID=89139 RepID=UPI0037422B4E
MPGIVMEDAGDSGSRRWTSPHSLHDNNGEPNSVRATESNGALAGSERASRYLNGSSKEPGLPHRHVNMTNDHPQKMARAEASAQEMRQPPPELPHITQGFFPYGQLVNRAVQQCWNDLSDLITELAEIQVSTQQQTPQLALTNGKTSGNQSTENVQKKLRLLEFAQAKRAEFIKLLVLSQWSRQAADVSKLIDIQGFIRTRHMAYNAAIQRVADMKRDLVRAQVANPDLETALEVLSTGRVSSMPDLGYKPPKPLTARRLLRTLRKINRIISTRLLLHDSVPASFHTYQVHDGRVTFFVPGEFEIDLSIAEEDPHSQFYFIDIRFLFSPSSPIPKGRFFNELDMRINNILRTEGLAGCFDFVHNLVLSNKINILFRQAVELSRGQWSDSLRVELIHRTLVVQYWVNKPGSKSWLEIGIRSGRQKTSAGQRAPRVPHLGLRWIRENKEVDSADISFDTETLSMESILRSAIALHISHWLRSAYARFSAEALFATRSLSLRAQLSTIEPGDCHLNVQLTRSRYLCASVEPVSGNICLRTTPTPLSLLEKDRNVDHDLVTRISRLRCIAAMEEIEANAKMLGWEIVDHRKLKVDIRRLFPSNILRASFFRHRLWQPGWIVAATTSLSGDDWWVLHLKPRPSPSSNLPPYSSASSEGFLIQSTRVVTGNLVTARKRLTYSFFANLEHSLAGIISMHANASWLADLRSLHSFPAVQKLQLGRNLEVPHLSIRFDISKLPEALRIHPPAGIRKKSYVKETICLSYHGFDPRAEAVIVVAYGRFHTPLRNLGLRTWKLDDSVILQRKGSGFAIRFLVTAGQPVIAELCERVQRLEIVLSVFESLRRNKVKIRSLSLSRLSFVYEPEQDLGANIVIQLSGPDSLADLDPSALRLETTSLFRLRLDISFAESNPHSRIRQSLAAILNQDDSYAGIDSVIRLLTFTLPLLRALDRLVTQSCNPSLTVQVSARGAKTYQFRYSGLRFRFLLTAGYRRDGMIWVLKDVSSSREKREEEEVIVGKLQERIYDAKRDGWQGLGNGAVADADKVGNLITELDSCFADVAPAASSRNGKDGEAGQTETKGPGGSTSVDASGRAAGTNANTSQAPDKPADPDVIMID